MPVPSKTSETVNALSTVQDDFCSMHTGMIGWLLTTLRSNKWLEPADGQIDGLFQLN